MSLGPSIPASPPGPPDPGRLPRVYIVLVNWNNAPDTIACLESLRALDYPNRHVLVCDNASGDDSLARMADWLAAHPGPGDGGGAPALLDETGPWPDGPPVGWATLLRCTANHGFGGGNNVGLRYALARGDLDYAWILNNDTRVDARALTELVARAAADPGIGICGSTLLDLADRRRVQARGGVVYDPVHARADHIGEGETFSWLAPAQVAAIEARMTAVQGASMLVSRAFLDTVGPMPHELFLYFEELEWAERNAGRFRPGYAQGSLVYHRQGGTIDYAARSFAATYYFTRNRLRFSRRYHRRHYPRSLVHVLLVLLRRVRERDLRTARIMWRAMRDA